MKIYLKDYLSTTVSGDKITSAFHFFDADSSVNGYLIALISVASEGDLDASNVARFVWNGILAEFKDGLSVNGSIENLKEAIAIGEELLKDLLRNDVAAEKGVNLNFSLAHYVGSKVFFGFYGESEILIYHEDELVDVSKLLKESDVNVGSTRMTMQDMMILKSSNFSNNGLQEGETTLNSVYDSLENADIELGEGALASSIGVNFQLLGAVDFPSTSEIVEEDDDIEIVVTDEIVDENDEVRDDVQNDINESEVSQEEVEIDNQTEENDEELEEADLVGSGLDSDEFLDQETPQEEPLKEPQQHDTAHISQEPTSQNRLRGALTKIRRFLLVLLVKIQPIWLKLSELISKKYTSFKSWFTRYLFNKYGRKTWFKKFRAKLSQSRISSVSPRNFKVGSYGEKTLRNKRFMIVGGVAVALVVAYMGVTTAQKLKIQSETNRKFDEFYSLVDAYVSKAENKAGTDIQTAETELYKAEKAITDTDLLDESLKVEDLELLDDLKGRVLGVNDTLGRVHTVSNSEDGFNLFIDARVELTDKADPSDIAIYKDDTLGEHLVITDKGNKAVYEVALFNKAVTKIADPNSLVKEPLFVDVGEEGVYLFDNVSGVIMAPFEKGRAQIGGFKSLTGVTKSDFSVSSPAEFAVLTVNDNLYLLDSATGSILKSIRSSSGSYSLPYTYLQDDVLTSATDFFADFSVYVTSESGDHFYRYNFNSETQQLIPAPILISGVRKDIGTISAGFTGGSLNQKIYLFDTEVKQIMAFEKPNESENVHPGEMVLKAQYAYRGDKTSVFDNLTDLVVNSQESVIYILDGTKIWSIELQ